MDTAIHLSAVYVQPGCTARQREQESFGDGPLARRHSENDRRRGGSPGLEAVRRAPKQAQRCGSYRQRPWRIGQVRFYAIVAVELILSCIVPRRL